MEDRFAEHHPLLEIISWAQRQKQFQDLQALIAPVLDACRPLEFRSAQACCGGVADTATGGAQWAPLTKRGGLCAAPFASISASSGSSGSAQKASSATSVLSSGVAASGQQVELTTPLKSLNGTWFKDKRRSQSMEAAMNMMHLNGIVRQAVKLVRGVRIDLTPENFTFTVFSYIGWFKVKEVYPMSGEVRQFKRRDLRRGKAEGWVEQHGDHLHVQLKWDAPFGGVGTDHFRLVNEDELHIESVLHVAGQTASYLTVYNRKHDRHHRHGHDGRSEDGHDDGGHHRN